MGEGIEALGGRERRKHTVAERLAFGWRTTRTGFRRDFAGIFILIPVSLICYSLGLSEWLSSLIAFGSAAIGGAPLGRALRRARARRMLRRSVETPSDHGQPEGDDRAEPV